MLLSKLLALIQVEGSMTMASWVNQGSETLKKVNEHVPGWLAGGGSDCLATVCEVNLLTGDLWQMATVMVHPFAGEDK